MVFGKRVLLVLFSFEFAAGFCHFVDHFIEELQSVFDGFGAEHVNASVTQKVDWGFGAAAFQEAQVVFAALFPQVQNTLRKRNGGREARGVLVYVEAVIEVRDARPFEGDVLVECNAVAEVLCVQLLIDAAERIGGSATFSSNSANMVWRYSVARNCSRKWFRK